MEKTIIKKVECLFIFIQYNKLIVEDNKVEHELKIIIPNVNKLLEFICKNKFKIKEWIAIEIKIFIFNNKIKKKYDELYI